MSLSTDESMIVELAIENYVTFFASIGIKLRLRRNFLTYAAIRRLYGDNDHLNQTFDAKYNKFSSNDFWLLAENKHGEEIATYCLRRFVVEDFFHLIRSQALWFGDRPRLVDPRFVVACAIPPFGGQVAHGGGLWVRDDYRGSYKLAIVLPRLARAIALRDDPFDNDSAMIRNDPRDPAPLADRKAVFMGIRAYGFARVHPFVDGWFPPEGRKAIMYLCHATRAEAVASLTVSLGAVPGNLAPVELPQPALVDEDEQLVDPSAVGGEGQKQACI
jgi:hypothetical protein